MQGDNLLALKALLPRYAGQVKCIYIDPPYNTGNEGWVYNDNVNSPIIQRWLKAVVGKEGEDLSRHDKWLCMMYPRLRVLREFLRDDGVIFVSIDDNESQSLKAILDEVFSSTNFVGNFIWKRRTTPDSRNLDGVSADHEYVVCYQKGNGFKVRGQDKDLSKYTNPDNDPRGSWMSDNLTGLANANERPNLHYNVVNPETGAMYPPHPSRGWIYGEERMAQVIAEKRMLWPKLPSGRPRLKRFQTDMLSDTTGFSTVLDAPGNVEATKELSRILGPKAFAFPKPSDLIKILISQATAPTDLILDSFAGSGTTGHAVLALNKEDGGGRRFILCEVEPLIARDITAERLRRVAAGYVKPDGTAIPGLGGGFRFLTLGEELFDAAGNVNPAVTFDDLARHVWFTETGEPLPETGAPLDSPLLGVSRAGNVGVYLLFNGILKDRSTRGGNALTRELLAGLPPHPTGPRIIYGTRSLLGADRLRRLGVTFKQIPFQLKLAR